MMTALYVMIAMGYSPARIDAVWTAAYNRMNQQSDVWFENGDFPRVIQLLRFQRAAFPRDYEVTTNLGWMLENVEEREEATKVYDRYLAENPQDPDAALPLAQQAFLKKDYTRAAAIASRHLSPQAHPNLWRIAANSYDRLGQFAKSRDTWIEYLKHHPDDLAAQRNLARVTEKIPKG